MSRENVETVRRGYELYAAGDLEGVNAMFSADVELADAGGLGAAGTAVGTRSGPDAFLRAAEEPLEAFEDYRVEPEEFIDADEAVVVPVRISGRGKASGAQLEMRLVHVWVLRNGNVIRGEVYLTRSEALEAVGLSE
jgi:ketosteroid isomerase-like protein